MTFSGCTGRVVRPHHEAYFDVLMEIATAIVVGEYAYIVGGEMRSLTDGQYVNAECESENNEFNVSR